MYKFSPMTPRVKKWRERLRNDVPFVEIGRYKLVTEFYMANPHIDGIMKRALNYRNLCENLPCYVFDDEMIVGSYVSKYRASALFPENSIDWLLEPLRSDTLSTREIDPYHIEDDDKEYILSTADFWLGECMNSKVNAYTPERYMEIAVGNGVIDVPPQNWAPVGVGHFIPNHKHAINKGFAVVKAEAEAKMLELETKGFEGDSADKYNFYRAVSIVCDGMMTLARRYSEECLRLAGLEKDEARKKELLQIADIMAWIITNPARNFREAIQAMWFHHMCVLLDANMGGTSMGRMDYLLGPYAEKDIADGVITREEVQELVDIFVLKIASQNKVAGTMTIKGGPGYTTGTLITLGGTDKDGEDITNIITYMCLEAVSRMFLHSPPIALRVNRKAPKKMWDCALAVNKRAGGVPSFYSDDVIIDSLVRRGVSREDAWDYGLTGCVEPSMGGYDWPACGGNGHFTFMNFVNLFLLAINNGRNPMRDKNGDLISEKPFGPQTGYLYEMSSIEEVKDAMLKHMDFWVTWNVNLINLFEALAREVLPQPVVSASTEGCMENGRDVMVGGAKYNSTGLAGVGLGNVTDSLAIIDRLCFKDKICTTRELYDAIMNNWEGAEDLRGYINNQLPRYGNGDPEVDAYSTWLAQSYADIANSKTGPRGRYAAGLYPVTMNVMFGLKTSATPDGRYSGQPLSDGISAVQGMDVSGPTAILDSVTCFDHREYSNGVLLNMKFHPTVLSTEEGFDKLRELMSTYFFDLGGGQMQMNIVSADTLRDAQKNPDKHQDLIIRIAGFSAYFVEVYKESQDDVISRTELGI